MSFLRCRFRALTLSHTVSPSSFCFKDPLKIFYSWTILYMHIMYFGHSASFHYPLLFLLTLNPLFPMCSSYYHVFFWMTFWWNVFVIYSSFSLLFLITAARLSLDGALFTDMDSLGVATSLKKMTPPSCSTNRSSPSLEGEGAQDPQSWLPLPMVTGCWRVLIYAELVQVPTAAISS